MASWRVQRYLAAAGLGSRRSCEDLISAGRVKVDGRPATLGIKVDPEASRVELDGQQVTLRPRKYYLALHKPAGYIVTKSDPRGRRTVMGLLRSLPYATLLNPVGRLDMDTEGLLLLTNDGELAHRLTHPSYEIQKTYEVTTNRKPTARQLEALRHGFNLDGRMTAPGEAHIVGGGWEERQRLRAPVRGQESVGAASLRTEPALRSTIGGRYWTVRLTIHEGRNRQIRRMFEQLGLPVLHLRRIAIGPVALGALPRAAHRSLTTKEVAELKGIAGLA